MNPSNHLAPVALAVFLVLGTFTACTVAPGTNADPDSSATPTPTLSATPTPAPPTPTPPANPCADLNCDDGRFCNGVESCTDGVCQPGEDPCPGQVCDQVLKACIDCRTNADCDDELFCNGIETCAEGNCVAGTSPCANGATCNEARAQCVAAFTLDLRGCPADGVTNGVEVALTAWVSGGLGDHATYAWRVTKGDAQVDSTRSKTIIVQTDGDDPVTVEVTALDMEAVDGKWVERSSAVAECTFGSPTLPTPTSDFADAPVSGVVPNDFGPVGGSFDLSVSPVDSAGELLTEGLGIGNFAFSEMQVTSLDAPGVIIATGIAVGLQLTVNAPSDPKHGVSVAILLDSTGSMLTNDPQRIRVDAGRELVEVLDIEDEAAVGDFRLPGQTTAGFRNLRLLQDFTSDHVLLRDALEQVGAQGSTPFYDAMLDGIDLFDLHDTTNPAIVALTDGQENASKFGNFGNVVAAAVAANIPIFPVGLGTDVDFTKLQQLAEQTGGTFASALHPEELTHLFESLGVAVTAGRVIVHTDVVFSPPLPSVGIFTVSGVLTTKIGSVSRESPISFQVELNGGAR